MSRPSCDSPNTNHDSPTPIRAFHFGLIAAGVLTLMFVPASIHAQKKEQRAPDLTVDTATRPADANNPARPPREVNESVITGGNVDESKISVTIHVDAGKGVDEATGVSQTEAVRTLAGAIARAMPHLNEGKGVRILLQPGVYRPDETVVIDGGSGAAHDAVLVIEGAEKGKVVISGAKSDGFEADKWELIDPTRRIYKIAWPHSWEKIDRGYYSIPKVELHFRESLAFNGRLMPLQLLEGWKFQDRRGRVYNEVGMLVESKAEGKGGYTYAGFQGLDKLEPGHVAFQTMNPKAKEFDNHPHANSILFRLPDGVDQLEGNEVAVGMVETLLDVKSKNNFVLRNLTFQNASGYYNGSGGAALTTETWGGPVNSRNWLIEHCEFSQNNVSGLDLYSVHDVTIRHTDLVDNGARGLHTIRVQNGRFEDMKVTGNNARGKLIDHVKHAVGGWDFRLVDCLFLRVNASENHGHGIRGDVIASNIIYRDCRINGNTASGGMMQEISWGPILVENCEINDNVGQAFLIVNVHDMTLRNNRIMNNDRGIYIVQMPKRHTVADMDIGTGGETGSGPNIVPIPQNLNTIVIGNTFHATGDANLIERSATSGDPKLYVEWYSKHYRGENNTFYNPDRTGVFNIGEAWKPQEYTDLKGWQEATGQDKNSRWAKPD